MCFSRTDTGKYITHATLVSEPSLLMRQRLDDYVFQLKSTVKVNGEEETLFVSPWPTFGNETQIINDGKRDKRTPNVGWMEMTYRGWPYVFVVALAQGVKRGDELLIDYHDTNYWQTREEVAREYDGITQGIIAASTAAKALRAAIA